MKNLNSFLKGKFGLLVVALTALWSWSAQAVQIDESFSGSWYNPDQSGHGFLVEVTDSGQLVVYWFVYDQQGNQAWMVGSGNITGETVVVPVVTTEGMVFGQFNPGTVSNNDFGELHVSFDSCNSGTVSYSVGFGSGELPIQRLTSLEGLECRAGGDDSPGDDDSPGNDDPVNGQCVDMEGVWTGQETLTITCSGQGQTNTDTITTGAAFPLQQEGCSFNFEQASESITGTVSGEQFTIAVDVSSDNDGTDDRRRRADRRVDVSSDNDGTDGLPFSSYTLTRAGTVNGDSATYTVTGSASASNGIDSINCTISGNGSITRQQSTLPSALSAGRSFEDELADLLESLK